MSFIVRGAPRIFFRVVVCHGAAAEVKLLAMDVNAEVQGCVVYDLVPSVVHVMWGDIKYHTKIAYIILVGTIKNMSVLHITFLMYTRSLPTLSLSLCPCALLHLHVLVIHSVRKI